MIRTQIQLSDEQKKRLDELSRARGKSVAALIREAVDRLLASRQPDRTTLYRRALDVVGRYEAGKRDVSVDHDRYLDEDTLA